LHDVVDGDIEAVPDDAQQFRCHADGSLVQAASDVPRKHLSLCGDLPIAQVRGTRLDPALRGP
jgi:hypothetical protein